jgi:hypothetical protein
MPVAVAPVRITRAVLVLRAVAVVVVVAVAIAVMVVAAAAGTLTTTTGKSRSWIFFPRDWKTCHDAQPGTAWQCMPA